MSNTIRRGHTRFEVEGKTFTDGFALINVYAHPRRFYIFTYSCHCLTPNDTSIRPVVYEDHKLFLRDLSVMTGIPDLEHWDYRGAPSLPN